MEPTTTICFKPKLDSRKIAKVQSVSTSPFLGTGPHPVDRDRANTVINLYIRTCEKIEDTRRLQGRDSTFTKNVETFKSLRHLYDTKIHLMQFCQVQSRRS